MLDINFLTRDQTQAPARESVESTDSTTREVPPLTAFNIFSLSLIFAALITMCLCVFLSGLILLGTLWFLGLGVWFFSQVREVFSYYVFKYVLSPFLSFPSGIPRMHIFVHLMSEFCYTILISSPFFYSVSIISITTCFSSCSITLYHLVHFWFLLVYFSFQLLYYSSVFGCSLYFITPGKNFQLISFCIHSSLEFFDHFCNHYPDLFLEYIAYLHFT